MDFQYPRTAADLTEEMLAMPADRLVQLARHPIRILTSQADIYPWLARCMADELKRRNAHGEPTRWILPVGPKGQYPILARICNEERISWKDVFAFHMDDYLDWQGRPIPPDHPFSFHGFVQKHLYDLLDPDLRPPDEQIAFPSVYDIDAFSQRLASVGGADNSFGGFGYRGLVAFNESPSTRWHRISADELAASKTRIVHLLDDTIVALSQRMLGGYSQLLPRMAITIGMADIIASRHVHLVLEGGAWKQYALRVFALTTERDPEYPVTLLNGHPSLEVTTDASCAAPIRFGLRP
jgi:glucosamine-6-phosphate deaminase